MYDKMVNISFLNRCFLPAPGSRLIAVDNDFWMTSTETCCVPLGKKLNYLTSIFPVYKTKQARNSCLQIYNFNAKNISPV